MNKIVTVRNLTRQFEVPDSSDSGNALARLFSRAASRTVTAVNDISFDVERGERVAFIGPNGAGKSTTIKMLTGILRPSSGEITVDGLVPTTDRRELAGRIGVVFGQRSQLWPTLDLMSGLRLLGRVYGLAREDLTGEINRVTSAFGLEPFLARPVGGLSLGERMRAEIAASLLHRPGILFLDEPSIGLDVEVKGHIRDLIHERAQVEGVTVFLTSHDAGDLEALAERVIVIREGQIIFDGPVEGLKNTFLRRKVITLGITEGTISVDLPGVTLRSSDTHKVTLEVDTDQVDIQKVVDAVLVQASLHDITIEDPPMEEIVRTIYNARGRAA